MRFSITLSKALPVGWTSPQIVAYVSGDTSSGDVPDDVSVHCNRNWLMGGVSSPTWNGTEWTVSVGAAGYNDQTTKSGVCGVFAGETLLDDFSFAFE